MMNVDRRVLSPVPSMDSGSDGEENLRISRNLRTTIQHIHTESGQQAGFHPLPATGVQIYGSRTKQKLQNIFLN